MIARLITAWFYTAVWQAIELLFWAAVTGTMLALLLWAWWS